MIDYEKIPIRRRAYYRALKRNEPWAIECRNHPFTFWMKVVYGAKHLRNYIERENWLFKLVPKEGSWTGGYIPVPFKLTKDC